MANARLCIVSKGVAMVTHAAVAWHGVPNGATSRSDRADTALTREILVYTRSGALLSNCLAMHCSGVLRHLSGSHCSQAVCLRLMRGLRYVEEAG